MSDTQNSSSLGHRAVCAIRGVGWFTAALLALTAVVAVALGFFKLTLWLGVSPEKVILGALIIASVCYVGKSLWETLKAQRARQTAEAKQPGAHPAFTLRKVLAKVLASLTAFVTHPFAVCLGVYLLLSGLLAYVSYATSSGLSAVTNPDLGLFDIFFLSIFAQTVFIAVSGSLLWCGWKLLALINSSFGRPMRVPKGDNDWFLVVAAGAIAMVATVLLWAVDPFRLWGSYLAAPILGLMLGTALIGWFRDCHEVVE
jgi:hypothetical protein